MRSKLAAAAFAAGLAFSFVLSHHPELCKLQWLPLLSLQSELGLAKAPLDPCTSGWRAELHEHLHKVVLIVNNNFDKHAEATTPMLRALYRPLFDKITFISPRGNPRAGIKARSSIPRLSSEWYWSYVALQDIVKDNPQAEGFLWMSDDVALNYWHLIKGNKSKIWMSQHRGRNFPFNPRAKSNFSDDYASEVQHRSFARMALSETDKSFKTQFRKSMLPYKSVFPKRVIDLVYLPKPYAEILAHKLIPVYLKHKVWWEIAMPMMLFSMLDPVEYDDVLDGMVYRWEHRGDKKDDYDPLRYWNPEAPGLHPWKLSAPLSRAKYARTLQSVDSCLLTSQFGKEADLVVSHRK